MAPQSAQMDAMRVGDLHLYAMKQTLPVVIGGHVVEVVAVVHKDVGRTIAGFAKYRRKKEGGLF